jgi:hypothetical protein
MQILDPLEMEYQAIMIEVSSFYGTQLNRCLHPSPGDGNRSSFGNVVISSFENTGRWTKSKNQVILSDIFINMSVYYYLPTFYSVTKDGLLASYTRNWLLLCHSVRIRFLTAMEPI